MATGENFKMIHWARKKEEKVKVNKSEEQRIRLKIKNLQDKRNNYYSNDDITDEELTNLEKGINEEINKLIDSMYKIK